MWHSMIPMFENESPEQRGVSSWGVSQRDGARGSAGATAPDSDPRGHAFAAEVFKHALCIMFLLAPMYAGASVISAHTVSSSDTGGIVVGSSGESVTDTGSASASVHSSIISDSSGSSVDITMTTEQGGVTNTESKHVEVPAGQDVSIYAATSSDTSAAVASQAALASSDVEAEQRKANISHEGVAKRPANVQVDLAGSAAALTDTPSPREESAAEPLGASLFSRAFGGLRAFVIHLF